MVLKKGIMLQNNLYKEWNSDKTMNLIFVIRNQGSVYIQNLNYK